MILTRCPRISSWPSTAARSGRTVTFTNRAGGFIPPDTARFIGWDIWAPFSRNQNNNPPADKGEDPSYDGKYRGRYRPACQPYDFYARCRCDQGRPTDFCFFAMRLRRMNSIQAEIPSPLLGAKRQPLGPFRKNERRECDDLGSTNLKSTTFYDGKIPEVPKYMVGATGIEPVTPSMSRRCSSAELRALKRGLIYRLQTGEARPRF